MKKLLLPVIIGLMAMMLAACNSDKEADQDKDKKETAQTEEKQQEEQAELQKKMDKQKVDEKKVVATVNDEKIMGAEYNNALSMVQMQMQQLGQDPTEKDAAENVKDQAIQSLVGQRLLIQDADKKGYTASKDEIKKQMSDIKGQYEDDKAFEKALKEAGLTEDEFNVQVEENIKYTKYMDKEIEVKEATDQEVQQYYDQMTAQGKESGQEIPELKDLKPQIVETLEQQKKQEKLAEHVEKLQKDAKVDINV
ncbi:SurA N-terminal domain-containing protein [Bacillus massiliglaciei]|uniref:SurA N-terminal domain-containing protein n=1 Tax=Bacillus massiliglaciei TaxID=1816693 RepID=UPI000A59477D|nr:SurA N-terminal domain-containing protein [Bacillus massiliglaciei]